jgi:hypothetical protein
MTSPFDAEDLRVLDELRDLHTELDPMPAGLVECAQFAVDLEAGFDIALIGPAEELAGARGEPARQITFECGEEVALMVQLQVHDDGHVRIDGWLTPPGCALELRTATTTSPVETSQLGRFVVDDLGHGLVQFVVRTEDATVVTPAIVL